MEDPRMEMAVIVPANQTKMLVVIILALCILTVTGVVLVTVLQPQNTTAADLIKDLMTPILMGLLAYALHSMSTSINGRMTQLIQATELKGQAKAKEEHVTGFVQGLAVNPNAALQPSDVPPDVLKK